MPHYDYQCKSCGHTDEVLQKMSDPILTECPSCRQESYARKLGGGSGLHFKGSGFYITDYPSSKDSCCPCGKSSPCG